MSIDRLNRGREKILSITIAMFAIFFAVTCMPQNAMATAKNCIFYEPGTVTLHGKLHRGVAVWMLELEKPVCIEGKENDKLGYYPTMDEVKNILIWIRKSDSPDKYTEYLNKDVVITGTLHHKSSDSGPGQTEIMVANVELAKP